jgi:trehalose/maltose transport system substrate-binding protein
VGEHEGLPQFAFIHWKEDIPMARIRIKKYRWLLALGFLVMLAALALTVTRDSMGLRASEHKTAPSGPIAVTPSFEIKDWPRNLRTDLRGASITVPLPENAPDGPWDDALLAKFRKLTGIAVYTLRPGNDTSEVLSRYLRDFATGSPQADVYSIDIVWPGILSDYAEDLLLAFGDLQDIVPSLVENDTVNGKLVAVPYYVEVSLLYFRGDLLEKYHFDTPPRTWNELEHQARVIADGERAAGNTNFWGFLWQGFASEALTCNALERQISQGGGWLLKPDGTVSLQRAPMVQASERSHRWFGALSPPDVGRHLEDDSLRIWKNGDAAFMRNWPYTYLESMQPESSIRNRIGVTLFPCGDGPNARHADVLGGFQLMVSKQSSHKDAAIELLKFSTSPEIQGVNAATRGYAPTRPALYDSGH